jgi:hypothetical protein
VNHITISKNFVTGLRQKVWNFVIYGGIDFLSICPEIYAVAKG